MTPPAPSVRWPRLAITFAAVVALAAGGWYAVARPKTGKAAESGHAAGAKPAPGVTVDVVRPTAGGIQRVVIQPGTVEPFASADIYSKVSGYLVEQSITLPDGTRELVDIGTRVKAGDVLARISVPEYEKQVQKDKARVESAKARVNQMQAAKASAEAEARAAEASVVLAKVMVRAKSAYRHYREKQLARVKELVARDAVDEKLRDEQEDYYLSSMEAENAASEQVNTSKEKAAAAAAKVKQADADTKQAEAEVGVAEEELAKSRVLVEYTTLRSPFTGVVTKRNFFPGEGGRLGDFIKAADQGGTVPLLRVEQTDTMRVVVQVPDRDAPYLSTKAMARIEIDSLPERVFTADGRTEFPVSRWAKAQDPATRTMRAEIDVPNPNGRLGSGMYGRVTLTLGGGTPNAVRIPSSGLAGKAEDGQGTVRVVRDGKVHLAPVRYAADNGVEAEIVSGLKPDDRVILRASGPVEEGTAVTVSAEHADH